jgi:hypothetical protein
MPGPGEPGTVAADLVAEALATHPGCTAAELAALAGLGQSTVSEALASMEAADVASRDVVAPVGGRRLAAGWSPVTRPNPHARTRRPQRHPTAAVRLRAAASGQLGTLVLEYLLAHPEQESTPVAVEKAVDRSSGAVANALATFAADGDAVLTSDAPRRYRIATA